MRLWRPHLWGFVATEWGEEGIFLSERGGMRTRTRRFHVLSMWRLHVLLLPVWGLFQKFQISFTGQLHKRQVDTRPLKVFNNAKYKQKTDQNDITTTLTLDSISLIFF